MTHGTYYLRKPRANSEPNIVQSTNLLFKIVHCKETFKVGNQSSSAELRNRELIKRQQKNKANPPREQTTVYSVTSAEKISRTSS